MNKRNHTKLQTAYEVVASAIQRGEFGDTKFLPSVAALSRMAQVSVFTMWKVIDRLRTEGRLAGARGHRLSLPERIVDPAPHLSIDMQRLACRQTKSHFLQEQIQRDILNGRYRHDNLLPSEKELTESYGVSRMTLRKALGALQEQSILSYRGKRFAPLSIANRKGQRRPRIMLLGHGSNMGHSITWGYWHQEYVKLLEIECAKAGFTLDVGCFIREEDKLLVINGRDWKQPFDVADKTDMEGYIYEVTSPQSIDDELLQTIARGGRPVAILDEMGSWPTPAFLKTHRNVRVFCNTLSAEPARHVARFALELGHRKAVYLSPFHNLEYSRRRFDGLQQAFGVVDGASIIPVTSQQDLSAYASQTASRANLEELGSLHATWVKSIPPVYAAAMREPYEALKSSAMEGRIREDLEKLLHRASRITEATMWIVVNDACACHAVDFLENDLRVAVPGDISVVSFDDTPIALTKGISSYNFNNASTMIAMLRYITNPGLFSVSKPIIEIQGYVIPRRTTRWASSR